MYNTPLLSRKLWIFLRRQVFWLYSLLRPSRFHFIGISDQVSKAVFEYYSSGNCTGLTPVSLLSHPSGQTELTPE